MFAIASREFFFYILFSRDKLGLSASHIYIYLSLYLSLYLAILNFLFSFTFYYYPFFYEYSHGVDNCGKLNLTKYFSLCLCLFFTLQALNTERNLLPLHTHIHFYLYFYIYNYIVTLTYVGIYTHLVYSNTDIYKT